LSDVSYASGFICTKIGTKSELQVLVSIKSIKWSIKNNLVIVS